MDVKCTFKNVKNSDILSEYIEQKISDLVIKYVQNEVSIDITFLNSSAENRVHCRLNGGDFMNLSAEGISESMSEAIEQMLRRLNHQASRKKDRAKERQNEGVKASKLPIKNVHPTWQEEAIDAEDILAYEKVMQNRRKAS